MIASWQESYDKSRQCVKKQRHHFADKGPYSQGYGLSSSHVQVWELDKKESRALKNWCFQTVVLEKTLESPLESKEIKTVNPEGTQSWIFIGRTDAEAEAPIIWPPDVKSQLVGNDPEAGKNWRQKEMRMPDVEMVGWLLEKTPGNGEGQGSLVCFSPWSHKESDRTEWLNNNNNYVQRMTKLEV